MIFTPRYCSITHHMWLEFTFFGVPHSIPIEIEDHKRGGRFEGLKYKYDTLSFHDYEILLPGETVRCIQVPTNITTTTEKVVYDFLISHERRVFLENSADTERTNVAQSTRFGPYKLILKKIPVGKRGPSGSDHYVASGYLERDYVTEVDYYDKCGRWKDSQALYMAQEYYLTQTGTICPP